LVLETEAGASWVAEFEARSMAQGMEKGRTEGEARGMEKVARNALAQGFEPEIVQKITGLDIQTITSLTS
jgi:predicted transposase YdaD